MRATLRQLLVNSASTVGRDIPSGIGGDHRNRVDDDDTLSHHDCLKRSGFPGGSGLEINSGTALGQGLSATFTESASGEVMALYAWRYRPKELPGFRIGKHWRYRRSDVEQWIQRRLKPESVRTDVAGPE